METNYQSTNTGQGLAIAGLVVGIIGFLLAVIPCTAIFGLILGLVGTGLSIAALVKASKTFSPKGMAIGGTVVSVLATLIAGIWGLWIYNLVDDADFYKNFNNKNQQNIYNQIDEDIDKDQINYNNDSLYFNADSTMNNLENDMDRLENGPGPAPKKNK